MLSLITALALVVGAAPSPAPPAPKVPVGQAAFTPAEATSFINRWQCDSYGTNPDDNQLLADRPAGPKVERFPIDKKRGVLIGKNSADDVVEPGATTPVIELLWDKDTRPTAQAFGALLALSYLPAPATCQRGACLFAFPDGSRSWFALRRDKKKELVAGIFPVQAKTEPASDPKFAAWLDGIDGVFGAVTDAQH